MRFKLLNLLLQSMDFSFGGNQVSFFLSQLGGLVADHPGEAVDVFEMSFHFTIESIGFGGQGAGFRFLGSNAAGESANFL